MNAAVRPVAWDLSRIIQKLLLFINWHKQTYDQHTLKHLRPVRGLR